MGDAPEQPNPSDWFGRAEDFVLMGQQPYRGVPCYLLECRSDRGGVHRWFVGVQDGLLRGKLHYTFDLTNESWMDEYREIQPGCLFPMSQGYHLFEEDEALHNSISGSRDITITHIAADTEFSEDVFQMEFEEGVQTFDYRFGAPVEYPYRNNMTEQDWQRIRTEAAAKRTPRKSGPKPPPDTSNRPRHS